MPESRHLCVSVHDVAPVTWRSCQRVLAAVREVAEIPVTLLVVPAYHGQCSALAPGFESAMTDQLAQGHELALHGYFHRDLGVPQSAVDWLRRRIYTAGEGEFWALSRDEAAERLLLGQRWFAANRWPLAGFVPPAWLLGPEAWHALREFPAFSYVTTFTHVHALHAGVSVRAPCLTFSTRRPWRRALSRAWADARMARSSIGAPGAAPAGRCLCRFAASVAAQARGAAAGSHTAHQSSGRAPTRGVRSQTRSARRKSRAGAASGKDAVRVARDCAAKAVSTSNAGRETAFSPKSSKARALL